MSLTSPSQMAPLVIGSAHRSRAQFGADLAAPLLRGLFLAVALGLPVAGSMLGARLGGGLVHIEMDRSVAGATR